jgi:hypothetical protein
MWLGLDCSQHARRMIHGLPVNARIVLCVLCFCL